MTITEAAEILRKHNEWRRWDGDWLDGPEQPIPKQIGEAIDVIVAYVERGA